MPTKTVNPLIRRLWDLGHFVNPAMPTGVNESDLPGLNLHDAEVKTALRSFQEFMAADFDRLSNDEHGRSGIADGEYGPATAKLFEVDRCGHPDYEMATEEAGSGSWPSNCRDDHPGLHTFSVQINKSGMPSFLQNVIEPAWDLVVQAYANMGILFIREDDNDRANTYVTWQRGAGWIGLAVVPRSPRCGERIWAKFDNRYQPGDILNQWARLLAHEFGHNMGMSHSRGGIMNPSITSGAFTPTAWRGDPSESLLRRYFGGIPVPTNGFPVPPTGPPPTDGDCPKIDLTKLFFQGSFVLSDEQKNPLREFILVPKPKV